MQHICKFVDILIRVLNNFIQLIIDRTGNARICSNNYRQRGFMSDVGCHSQFNLWNMTRAFRLTRVHRSFRTINNFSQIHVWTFCSQRCRRQKFRALVTPDYFFVVMQTIYCTIVCNIGKARLNSITSIPINFLLCSHWCYWWIINYPLTGSISSISFNCFGNNWFIGYMIL